MAFFSFCNYPQNFSKNVTTKKSEVVKSNGESTCFKLVKRLSVKINVPRVRSVCFALFTLFYFQHLPLLASISHACKIVRKWILNNFFMLSFFPVCLTRQCPYETQAEKKAFLHEIFTVQSLNWILKIKQEK